MMTNKDLNDFLKQYSEYTKHYFYKNEYYKNEYSIDDTIDDSMDGVCNCIDYILDSLTWTNIKSKLKKLIYYLR